MSTIGLREYVEAYGDPLTNKHQIVEVLINGRVDLAVLCDRPLPRVLEWPRGRYPIRGWIEQEFAKLPGGSEMPEPLSKLCDLNVDSLSLRQVPCLLGYECILSTRWFIKGHRFVT